MPQIDHLVFACPDLATGVAHVEELTGARAVAGGPHPGIGTRNALLSLDGGCYLEIIAVDPDQPTPERPRPFGLDEGRPPGLAGFAVHPGPGESIDDVAATLRASGFDPGPVVGMHRVTPDGVALHWRLTRPSGAPAPGDGVLPFVIDWGDTTSPARTAPAVGSLEQLEVRHPEADVRAALEALGMGLVIGTGPAGLSAVVLTPRGRVTLG